MSGMARPEVCEMISGSSSWRHIVAMPWASVRPYPVTIVLNVSSSRIRRIISTGTAAAPVTDSRSVDVS